VDSSDSKTHEALHRIVRRILALRTPDGHWEGRLSSSALSTATAAFALHLVDGVAHRDLIRRGLDWLAAHRNDDGGWGDTDRSKSNISTTLLVWSALAAADPPAKSDRRAVALAESWIAGAAGGLAPRRIAAAVNAVYGGDRTFSAPILTMCALAGRLGGDGWRRIAQLPFELGALPHRWLRWVRLPVVSYALPALIAIGQVRHHFRPTRNPLLRMVRGLARERTLDRLAHIQPRSGGFLEAAPLTSFVVMALAAMGCRDHPVVTRGAEFLIRSVREDGSWPIDTNLATWVTTLSVNALAAVGRIEKHLTPDDRGRIRNWLLDQQCKGRHPYTDSPPGGWGWTGLSGAVPDADDTAGALLALRELGAADDAVRTAAADGVEWLLRLQNRDGGIPTFCKGWGRLPFDRSSPDLTAHALRAWGAWRDDLPPGLRARTRRAIPVAVSYLARTQRTDGSWVPLWFGNQHAPNRENPTYGTARVVSALAELPVREIPTAGPLLARGVGWLLAARRADGGWGGGAASPSTVEETAVAVDALARVLLMCGAAPASSPLGGGGGLLPSEQIRSAVRSGVAWLIERTTDLDALRPAPIGFYFASLWYYEQMYPLVFTVSALQSALRIP